METKHVFKLDSNCRLVGIRQRLQHGSLNFVFGVRIATHGISLAQLEDLMI
jgi:hypothetical protein